MNRGRTRKIPPRKPPHPACIHVNLSFLIAFFAALLMSIPGLPLSLAVDALLPEMKALFYPHYSKWGLYIDPDSVIGFWIMASAMMVATALIRRDIRIRWTFAVAPLLLMLLLMHGYDWSNFYEKDIIFSQADSANQAILMAPLILLAQPAALLWQLIAPAATRRIAGSLPGRAGAAITRLILTWFGTIFAAVWIIVTQPEWTDLFRFSSRFASQGRGG